MTDTRPLSVFAYTGWEMDQVALNFGPRRPKSKTTDTDSAIANIKGRQTYR
jgi:hypothetical protein